MAETWLSYADVGTALDITPEAARQKAICGRWRRQRDNAGRALVLVDIDAEKAANAGKRPSNARPKRPSDTRTIEALQGHIATLQADLAKSEALAEQRLTEAETARKRNDELVAALLSMAERVRLADERRWRLWRAGFRFRSGPPGDQNSTGGASGA